MTRGKIPFAAPFACQGRWASMRPPHDAGENREQPEPSEDLPFASMRPPHDAGENLPNGRELDDRTPASMRPPHDAGENFRATRKAWQAVELQ